MVGIPTLKSLKYLEAGWKPEKQYFDADYAKFQKFWHGNAIRTQIIDMPKAIEDKLVKIAPNSLRGIEIRRI